MHLQCALKETPRQRALITSSQASLQPTAGGLAAFPKDPAAAPLADTVAQPFTHTPNGADGIAAGASHSQRECFSV